MTYLDANCRQKTTKAIQEEQTKDLPHFSKSGNLYCKQVLHTQYFHDLRVNRWYTLGNVRPAVSNMLKNQTHNLILDWIIIERT